MHPFLFSDKGPQKLTKQHRDDEEDDERQVWGERGWADGNGEKEEDVGIHTFTWDWVPWELGVLEI